MAAVVGVGACSCGGGGAARGSSGLGDRPEHWQMWVHAVAGALAGAGVGTHQCGIGRRRAVSTAGMGGRAEAQICS